MDDLVPSTDLVGRVAKTVPTAQQGQESAAAQTAEAGRVRDRDDSGTGTHRPSLKKAGTIYVAGVGVAVIVTVFSVWCYTRTYSGRESRLAAVGLLTLYAAAATLAGALVGFLFGVPRHVVVLTAADGSSIPQSAARLSVSKDGNAPNTNLEQISDWLTKILVGATLVQLERIPPAASALFSSLAAAVDSDFRCKAFVGALVTYSGIAGFIVGWLTTRVWIGRLLCMVDHADGADS